MEFLNEYKHNQEKRDEKKAVYSEKLDEPSYQALYEECWELLQVLFKAQEENDKKKKTMDIQHKKLRERKRGYD